MDQYKEFKKYYDEVFGITFGFWYHRPKGNAREKATIRNYMTKAELNSDCGLADVMLEMAFEIKDKCNDVEFHHEIADRRNEVCRKSSRSKR